ncbi:uncharacterized protein [Misgurnus anguillicaudatus]|uniref:uncharacterized protein n=1 Tax=Misgurnus anguillicaudatus TaxID=75329 RepID=UPI003CCF0919
MEKPRHRCSVCDKTFTEKSNLTRHLKIHAVVRETFDCDVCKKSLTTKSLLVSHQQQHKYPNIVLYRQGEARLQCTEAAKSVAEAPSTVVDPTWLDRKTAEAAAKRSGGELWKGQLVIVFGKYAGQTFRWLLENDVGWLVWLLFQYCQQGEQNELLKWQKERLLEYAREFPPVTWHLDRRLKTAQLKKDRAPLTVPDLSQQDPNYTSDAELLAAAETVLDESEASVSTQLTTWGDLASSVCQDDRPGPSSLRETSEPGGVVLEGWQKFWEQPPESTKALGIAPANIKWLKTNETYGLFERASKYKNVRGEIAERKIFKEKMEFHPPPPPMAVKGAVPNMLSFFTTPAFFWRPVGVMKALIRCPNTNCRAPPEYYLEKKGFGSFARQVCSMNFHYTLLTERLMCKHCLKLREELSQAQVVNSDDEEDGPHRAQQQYTWLAYSPKILMNLAPAIRSMFPAIICGKRAVDRSVVTLMSDRLNAVSMSKVQRLLKQGHDEWYVERRDLYQTLLYDVHMSAAGASSSQRGILSFARAAGTYTPPIALSPHPSARVLRRAHLILEMEKMPVYRDQILSTTGEILCIDGTRKILKKIYGDGQGTMQYVTSVLNEWGQFLTTVVVASESEGCCARMARGLVARFRRANAPAPKVVYADNNCCRDSGPSFLENLFGDWVKRGTVIRLDIRHWLHRWDAVVIKQSHAKYGAFMSAMAGAVLAYNKADMMLLVQAVRNGNPELYGRYSDEEMMAFLKPHQIRSYVRRITRGVAVS